MGDAISDHVHLPTICHREPAAIDYGEEMGADNRKPEAPPAPPTPMSRSRTATVDDPLTTQVLAEVARRAQTMELDPEALRRLVNHHEEDDEDEDTAETAHPHVRERR